MIGNGDHKQVEGNRYAIKIRDKNDVFLVGEGATHRCGQQNPLKYHFNCKKSRWDTNDHHSGNITVNLNLIAGKVYIFQTVNESTSNFKSNLLKIVNNQNHKFIRNEFEYFKLNGKVSLDNIINSVSNDRQPGGTAIKKLRPTVLKDPVKCYTHHWDKLLNPFIKIGTEAVPSVITSTYNDKKIRKFLKVFSKNKNQANLMRSKNLSNV